MMSILLTTAPTPPPIHFQHAARPWLRQCLRHRAFPAVTVRCMSLNGQKKIIEAEAEWQKRAVEVRAGKKQSTLSFLEERGYVNQLAGDRKVIDQLLTDKRIGVYCGVDPTAPSLHVGHLLPFMVIFWMYLLGFKAFTLIGSDTAKIGDPTGRSVARDPVTGPTRAGNARNINQQMKHLWNSVERMGRKYGLEIENGARRGVENNTVWYQKLPLVHFLKIMGLGMRLGPMLSRDAVKLRQKSGDGMSFAEFSYPVMQAWDWWELYQRHSVQLQVGGSDQFGNIVLGIDAVNHVRDKHPPGKPTDHPTLGRVALTSDDKTLSPYGLTTPLLTTGSGRKIGKSAGNAIWLDKELTTPFDLYGYFIRFADADVERYLRIFTFMPMSEITSIMEEHNQDPRKRVAQHRLAHEFVEFVHGQAAAEEAASQHKKLFGGAPKPPVDGKPNSVLDSWEKHKSILKVLPMSLVYYRQLPSVLWSAGLARSKTQAQDQLENGGIYVGTLPEDSNGKVIFKRANVQDPPESLILDGNRLLLRHGKKHIKLVKVVSDQEFLERGLMVPGWNQIEPQVKGLAKSKQ